MASPIAHTLVGLSIYWIGTSAVDRKTWVALIVVAAASLPDLDLLLDLIGVFEQHYHRAFSHSLLFGFIPATACWILLRRTSIKPILFRISLLVYLSVTSHTILDYISQDYFEPYGVAIWWPINGSFEIAPIQIFSNIERTNIFSFETIVHNLKAGFRELYIIGPFAITAFLLNRN